MINQLRLRCDYQRSTANQHAAMTIAPKRFPTRRYEHKQSFALVPGSIFDQQSPHSGPCVEPGPTQTALNEKTRIQASQATVLRQILGLLVVSCPFSHGMRSARGAHARNGPGTTKRSSDLRPIVECRRLHSLWKSGGQIESPSF